MDWLAGLTLADPLLTISVSCTLFEGISDLIGDVALSEQLAGLHLGSLKRLNTSTLGVGFGFWHALVSCSASAG